MSKRPLRHGKKSRHAAHGEPWHKAEQIHLVAHAQAKAEREAMRIRLKDLRREIMRADAIQAREAALAEQSAAT